MLILDLPKNRLLDPRRRQRFDPLRRSWVAWRGAARGERVDPVAAVSWLQFVSGTPLRAPIGVIGPRAATARQLRVAESLGGILGELGLAIVCGGRQGIMEAVCRGAASKGGVTIGLLPDSDATAANAYVGIPIATGIGEARNALVARAALCLVAIGDSYGTLSEVALGLQFGKPVFGLAGAARVAGMRQCRNVAEVVAHVAAEVLRLDGG
jgi:hypothetical protein